MSLTIHVIHTVASLGVSAGGPSRTVPALCAAVAAACPNTTVEIVTAEQPVYGRNLEATGVPTYTAAAGSGGAALRSLLAQRIDAALASHDAVLLHDHGQWLALNRASAAAARSRGLKRVVSPRGMLTPWALRHRAWKKRAAWLLYARRDFREASVLHATSAEEASEFRGLGARQPIALIPNGVHYHEPRQPAPSKTRTMVFLSRLHPKKGVQELVTAWRAVAPSGWRLVLAGPDEAHMLAQLNLSSADTIDYVGEVEGDQKWNLLESASVAVLPSYSENFGVVVAEALMAGTPAIATHGTPWQGLASHGCGWWIPMTPAALAETLRTVTTLDEASLAEMGRRGREWVTASFTWPSIGRKMAAVYRWMACDGDAPAWVAH